MTDKSVKNDGVDAPYISVIIPFKNAEQTIGITLSSVIGQTFKDFEVILVNDGAEDASQNIVDAISDPRFRVLKNHRSEGPAGAKNKAMKVAKGQILSFLDADDFWSPQYLEKVLAIYLRNSNVDVVYAFFIKQINSKLSGSNIYPQVLHQGWLCAPSVLSVRSSFLRENNLFWDASYVHSEDDVFCFKLSKNACIYALEEPLVYYGAGPGNISTDTRGRAEGFLRLYMDYEKDIKEKCGSRSYAKHMFTVANTFAAEGNFLKANGIFFRSFFRDYVFGKSKLEVDLISPVSDYLSLFKSYASRIYKIFNGGHR